MSLPGLKDDIREALRRIRRNPRTSLLAVGTLILGIGAATAVFTMAHAMLLAPPPYRDPDRIVRLSVRRLGQPAASGTAFDYRREPGLFDAAALTDYSEFNWTGQSLPGFDGAEVLRGLIVTADYFRVLDQPMAAGRGFAPGEDQPGRDLVAVLSYSLWQRRFGGNPAIVGQSVTLNGKPHTVVGIAGPRFLPYEFYDVQAWVPFTPDPQWRYFRDCFARMAPGITLAQAQQRLDAVNARLAQASPPANRGYSVTLEPLLEQARKDARPAVQALVGAAVCLLLIAAANVASLLLARATRQAREIAIRAALGAGRFRLYRMMMAESTILALIASAGGCLLGAWLLSAAKALMPRSVQYDWAFALDTRIFVAAFAVSALAGLVSGLAPAFETVRAAAGGLRPSFGRTRLLRGIVTAEVALAVLLSMGAGLLGKSFLALENRPLGYNPDHVLGMRIRLIGDRYQGTDRKAAYWSGLIERAAAVPGVALAASVSDLPMGEQYSGGGFEIAGRAPPPGEPRIRGHHMVASPGYFATAGIPLLAGRGFTEADSPQSEPVAIVNDLLAETYWPGQSALGHQLRNGPSEPWRRIVGVVRKVRHGGPLDEYENQIYVPYRQQNTSTMFLVLRTHVPPEALIPAVRATLKSLDPDVPAFLIRSMKQSFDAGIAEPRLPMVLTVGFAALAALLAALGLFGVIGYWVSQRTRELGTRSALGASGAALRGMVLRQGGGLAAAGLLLGLCGSFAAMRLLRSLLFGMSERDVTVYAGVTLLSIVSALLACWIPAAQAARTDPAVALREDG